MLEEALTLPDLPEGFQALARLVMSGALTDASVVASACDVLWSGLVQWAKERGYTLVASREIPF